MGAYISRRLLLAVPVIIGILFATFALARLIPGDPCRAQLGEKATDAICDAFNERYGLNKPIPTQFAIYMNDVVHGDLGKSIRLNRPTTTLIAERLPVTIELALAALLFATIFGITLGITSAYWHNSAIDLGTMVGANIGVSIPIFVLGLLLAYTFSVLLKGTPFALPPSGRLTAGMDEPNIAVAWGLSNLSGAPRGFLNFLSRMYVLAGLLTFRFDIVRDAGKHLILPMIALGTIPLAIIARMTRSSVLEVMSLDYMRTARSKGLTEQRVVFRHAMRNAMLPIVTIIGLQLGALLSGAILTETIFGVTGVGKTLYDAITSRDYTVVQAFTLVIAVIFVMINLVVDVSYGVLDPRIRLS